MLLEARAIFGILVNIYKCIKKVSIYTFNSVQCFEYVNNEWQLSIVLDSFHSLGLFVNLVRIFTILKREVLQHLAIYNYFLFGREVILLHTKSRVASVASHERRGVQKYYFSTKKKVNVLRSFNIITCNENCFKNYTSMIIKKSNSYSRCHHGYAM